MTPAVVIVTCFGGPLLERCVCALHAQRLPPRTILVVVSTDQTIPLPDGIETLHLGQRRGFAHGANAGIRAVGPGPVVVLNDDTIAAPDFIAQLVEAHKRGGEGVYQPRIRLADGSGRLDNTGHRLFVDGFNLARGRGQPDRTAPRADPASAGEIGAFSGAAVMLTDAVLREVGLFDEDLEAFGEDVDLSLRARRQGFRLNYVPGALIEHVLGASYGRTGTRKIFLVERNRLRLAIRSLPATAVLTMPAWTVIRLSALGVAALGGRGLAADLGLRGATAAVAGSLAGLTTIPDALRKRRRDQQRWTEGEWGMWKHLLRHHVRPSDLLGRA